MELSNIKQYDFPELMVNVGIDEGENLLVQYAYDNSSQIDILGYTWIYYECSSKNNFIDTLFSK